MLPRLVIIGLIVAALMLRSKPARATLTTRSGAASWKQSANAAKYLPLLAAAEKRHGLPRDLLARQAYQESRFRADIVSGQTISSAGALGIMQIVPKHHPSAKPLDVPAAIDYAARLLRALKEKFGTWELALAAYNAGPAAVAKYSGVPPFQETRRYVSEILADVPHARQA